MRRIVSPISDDRRPMLVADQPDEDEPPFLSDPSGDSQQIPVEPKRLGLHEIDTVFGLVRTALGLVELKNVLNAAVPLL